MSYITQFLPQADIIGTVKFFPHVGTSVVTQDGQEWLKTGKAKDKTNYPIAAITPSCQIIGIATSGYSGGDIRASATNGTGTIVVVPTSNTSNVYVTTNYGASWTAVAHNLGTTPSGVAYNGTTWVVVGNSTSNLIVSTSTNPTTTWTLVGNVLSIQGGGASADTASVCWDSTSSRFIAVTAGGSLTNASGYSANGVTWTGVNLTSALAGTTFIASTGGITLACGYSGTAVNKTVNGGTSWTSATNTVTNYGNLVAASGKFFRPTTFDTTMVYTVDGTTWVTSSVPDSSISINVDKQVLVSDGTTLFFNTPSRYIGSTTDGVTFACKGLNVSNNYGTSLAIGGVNKLFGYAASSNHFYSQNMSNCDLVGTAYSFYSAGGTYSPSSMAGYIRIK